MIGCGGAADGTGDAQLTCATIASPTNCWAANAAKAYAKLPPSPMQLCADRTSCLTGGDITVLRFDAPLPSQTTDLDHFAFDAGAWSFDDTGHNHIELTVDGALTTLSLSNGIYTMECEDGTTYSASFSDVIACPRAPTDGFAVDATSVQFTLVAPAVPAPTFTCSE